MRGVIRAVRVSVECEERREYQFLPPSTQEGVYATTVISVSWRWLAAGKNWCCLWALWHNLEILPSVVIQQLTVFYGCTLCTEAQRQRRTKPVRCVCCHTSVEHHLLHVAQDGLHLALSLQRWPFLFCCTAKGSSCYLGLRATDNLGLLCRFCYCQ